VSLWHKPCCLAHPRESQEPWRCPDCGCLWVWAERDGEHAEGFVGDFSDPAWDWMFARA
jgi:hypothetical protein